MIFSDSRFARGLEMAVAIAALVTSVTSIWLSLSQGDEMARLVQAQSWPYLEYESSNTGDDGPQIDLVVRNAGVGPAKVESFAVLWDGKPVKGWASLVKACCLADGTPTNQPLDIPKLTGGHALSSKLIQRVLRASDSVTLLRLPKSEANAELWTKLDDARFRIQFRICYCSVFDECWTSDLRSTTQTLVKACPVEPVPYIE